jgi:hypothetical protein
MCTANGSEIYGLVRYTARSYIGPLSLGSATVDRQAFSGAFFDFARSHECFKGITDDTFAYLRATATMLSNEEEEIKR